MSGAGLLFRSVVALAVLGGLLIGCSRQPAFRGMPLDPPRELLDFTLRDQFGQPVRLADLRDRVRVLTFLYTSCPDVCPLVAGKLRRAYELLEDPSEVAFLAVTVDPERDTEARVYEYSEQYGMLDRWQFLIGTHESLQPLWDYYWVGQVSKEATGSYTVRHTTPIHLIDRRGRIRVVYGNTFRAAELAQDIELLLEQ
ncbi:MAG: SCO family protein [Candidatus Methylomirabilia bacterium]